MINFIIIFFASFLIALALKDLKVTKISSLYDIPEKELYNMVSLDTYFVIVEMRALEKAFNYSVELIKFFKEEIQNIDFLKRTIIELSLYALQKNISDSVDNLLYFNKKRFRLKTKLKNMVLIKLLSR